jgi:hypothetical protein
MQTFGHSRATHSWLHCSYYDRLAAPYWELPRSGKICHLSHPWSAQICHLSQSVKRVQPHWGKHFCFAFTYLVRSESFLRCLRQLCGYRRVLCYESVWWYFVSPRASATFNASGWLLSSGSCQCSNRFISLVSTRCFRNRFKVVVFSRT